MSNKVAVSSKVEPTLKDEIDDYADEHEMKRSPAIRDLVKEGLAAQEDTPFRVPLSLYLAWLGTLAAAAGLLEASEIVGIGGAVLFALALAYHVTQNGPLFSNE